MPANRDSARTRNTQNLCRVRIVRLLGSRRARLPPAHCGEVCCGWWMCCCQRVFLRELSRVWSSPRLVSMDVAFTGLNQFRQMIESFYVVAILRVLSLDLASVECLYSLAEL